MAAMVSHRSGPQNRRHRAPSLSAFEGVEMTAFRNRRERFASRELSMLRCGKVFRDAESLAALQNERHKSLILLE